LDAANVMGRSVVRALPNGRTDARGDREAAAGRTFEA